MAGSAASRSSTRRRTQPDAPSPRHTRREVPADPTVLALRREPNRVVRLFRMLGPGLITGASDDDPSGIGTYATAGASLGYSTLWLMLVTFPLMASFQFICARIGLVSGRGLAGVLRQHYPRPLLFVAVAALTVANTINAGADIGAVAAAVNMLVPIPAVWLVTPIAIAILALQLWGSYDLIARVFKWLTLALLAYVGAALFARPDPLAVVRGTFLPSFSLDPAFLATLVAILGTTISPYLFFWQADQEVEEQIAMGRTKLWQRKGASDAELEYKFWDVNMGMGLSNVVAYFIILATAATLFAHGHHNVSSATDAAQALAPIAGPAASLLLAVGLIGAGVLAIPVLTGSAAYAVSEAFAWPFGLNKSPARARQFYAVIAVSTLIGVAINFLGINPIEALFVTAVINGLLAAPLMVLIMLVANDKRVMRERANGRVSNVLGWLATLVMAAAALTLIWTTIGG